MNDVNKKLIEGLLAVKILIAEKEIETLLASLDVTEAPEPSKEMLEEDFKERIREGLDLKEMADKIVSLIDIRRK
jgi:hypothetical protein